MEAKKIKYPYLPEGSTILYVPISNPYMAEAKQYAKKYYDKLWQAGAAVVVKNNQVIGLGSIGNNPTHLQGCERIKQNMPTGQGYDLCDGCNPKFHSEPSAIRDAQSKGNDTSGADLYLWGHWWFCEPCWNAMIVTGVRNVYLLENSRNAFLIENPDNIIGKQFE